MGRLRRFLRRHRVLHQELGFTEAVFQRMIETTSLMGRQTADSSRYTVSWTYHPDRGLEVMYEKK